MTSEWDDIGEGDDDIELASAVATPTEATSMNNVSNDKKNLFNNNIKWTTAESEDDEKDKYNSDWPFNPRDFHNMKWMMSFDELEYDCNTIMEEDDESFDG